MQKLQHKCVIFISANLYDEDASLLQLKVIKYVSLLTFQKGVRD